MTLACDRWILPASDADLWLTSGSAAYYDALLGKRANRTLDALRVAARSQSIRENTPLSRLKLTLDNDAPNRLASAKGALVLDALRSEVGDDKFFPLMKKFFDDNTTKNVTTQAFREAASHAAGKPLDTFFTAWLDGTAIPGDKGGPSYLAAEMQNRFGSMLIVYGTMAEAGANRYAAEQFRLHDVFEHSPLIKKDFEVTDEDLRTHDVVFIGRPEANQALAALAGRIGLTYDGGNFVIDGKPHASEYDALDYAAANPFDAHRMMLVVAGNSALETVKAAKHSLEPAACTLLRNGKSD